MGIPGRKSQNIMTTEIGGTDTVHHQRGQSWKGHQKGHTRTEKGGVIETVEIEGVIETVIGNLRRGIETEGGVEKERRTGIEIEMGIETDIGIKDDEAILLFKCFVKKKW